MANKETDVITLQDVMIELNGNIVGGAQSLSFTWEQNNEPKHQGGSKKPFGIRDGEITINGSLEQFWLNTDDIKSLVDIENGKSPYFTLVGVTQNKSPERKVKIIDAKFKNIGGELGLTDDATISREFDACDFDMK